MFDSFAGKANVQVALDERWFVPSLSVSDSVADLFLTILEEFNRILSRTKNVTKDSDDTGCKRIIPCQTSDCTFKPTNTVGKDSRKATKLSVWLTVVIVEIGVVEESRCNFRSRFDLVQDHFSEIDNLIGEKLKLSHVQHFLDFCDLRLQLFKSLDVMEKVWGLSIAAIFDDFLDSSIDDLTSLTGDGEVFWRRWLLISSTACATTTSSTASSSSGRTSIRSLWGSWSGLVRRWLSVSLIPRCSLPWSLWSFWNRLTPRCGSSWPSLRIGIWWLCVPCGGLLSGFAWCLGRGRLCLTWLLLSNLRDFVCSCGSGLGYLCDSRCVKTLFDLL